ncbi:MAG: FecR domain-containing protein [Bacteroidales bacterium]|nr:FecR domain-containing protein [Bacteroidales bacterium]
MRRYLENINWDLLSKNLTGDASELEKAELESWLALDDKNRMLYKELKNLTENKDAFKSVQQLDIEQALRKVKASNAKVRVITFRKLAQIAAVFIIVLGLSFLFRYDFLNPEITVKTKEGERTEVLLADMSKVSVNENSVFVYPKKFKGPARKVKLVGEAYFIVNHDKTKPFIVEVDEAYVKVLGTEFNIKNQHYTEEISVLVTKGSVQFGSNIANTEPIVLKKGDAGRYNKVKQTLDYENNPDFNNIAWKTKLIKFENETLEKVARELEDVYFIELEIEEELKSRKISATYDDQPVEMILQILEATLNVKIIELSKDKYKIGSK